MPGKDPRVWVVKKIFGVPRRFVPIFPPRKGGEF